MWEHSSNKMDTPVAFLKGFRALDLTGLSGQLCGRILGDLGMEVIKIEPPGGDPVRNLAPFVTSPDGKTLSTVFAHLNAGKSSKVLDLDKESDRAAFKEIGRDGGCRAGKLSAGGAGPQGPRLHRSGRINPGVVMASITAFGQTGPKKNLLYNDLVALAESGFLYISGDPLLAAL